MVSTGADDADRSIEELEAAIRHALRGGKVRARNVTVTTGYYIVDGRVCLPRDYDPERQDFLPGRFPPPWAGGPTDARTKTEQVKQDEGPVEYVRVEPTRTAERGPSGRRIRSDRGASRSPRKVKTDSI